MLLTCSVRDDFVSDVSASRTSMSYHNCYRTFRTSLDLLVPFLFYDLIVYFHLSSSSSHQQQKSHQLTINLFYHDSKIIPKSL